MSTKEGDRLAFVRQAFAGQAPVRRGAEVLGITGRRLQRGVERQRSEGTARHVYRSRGRSSNR